MSKVLITDSSFADLRVEEGILAPLGCLLDSRQCKSPDLLVPAARDADFVLTQFAPVNRDVIAAMDRAKLIVRYGVGVDNVDLDAARERGIPVCNVPDYCVDEVADQTLGFILAATRQIVPNCLRVREGKWGLAVTVPEMKALREMTVGVLGLGRIGREVVHRLLPFRCQVRVSDPGGPPAPPDVQRDPGAAHCFGELGRPAQTPGRSGERHRPGRARRTPRERGERSGTGPMTNLRPAVSTRTVQVDKLRDFTREAFRRSGLSDSDAAVGADILTTTDAWGVFTHGTKSLAGYLRRLRAGGLRASARPTVVAEGPSWAILDGG